MAKQSKTENYLSEVNSGSGSRKGELGNDSETILSVMKSILLDLFFNSVDFRCRSLHPRDPDLNVSHCTEVLDFIHILSPFFVCMAC